MRNRRETWWEELQQHDNLITAFIKKFISFQIHRFISVQSDFSSIRSQIDKIWIQTKIELNSETFSIAEVKSVGTFKTKIMHCFVTIFTINFSVSTLAGEEAQECSTQGVCARDVDKRRCNRRRRETRAKWERNQSEKKDSLFVINHRMLVVIG
jgi:hypothetical protein